jgi:hypothetical protein
MSLKRSHAVVSLSGEYIGHFFHRAITLRGSTTLNKREMPITVQNNLPTLSLRLGDYSNQHGDIELKVLFDTCKALSTGFKAYHDRIRQLHPELVHAYENFDGMNPFKPIRLSGALRNPDDVSQEVTGALTSVIRYKTPYVDCNGNPVLLSFTLGDTVSCNTILVMIFIEQDLIPKEDKGAYNHV